VFYYHGILILENVGTNPGIFMTFATGMLENFAGLIEKYGMIPNGNRVYYTRRTQPPLFIAMVDEYYKVTEFTRYPLSQHHRHTACLGKFLRS
jgi:alpha,alpha-trehalase